MSPLLHGGGNYLLEQVWANAPGNTKVRKKTKTIQDVKQKNNNHVF